MFYLAQVTIDLAGEASKQGLPYTSATQTPITFISDLLSGIIKVGAIAVFILLLWGGLEWILAGGEKSKVESARNKITGSIIGFVVLLSTLALFGVIQSVFHLDVLTFK